MFDVVGGAGGKLNHLKLTGVKSEEEYKADSKRLFEKGLQGRNVMFGSGNCAGSKPKSAHFRHLSGTSLPFQTAS